MGGGRGGEEVDVSAGRDAPTGGGGVGGGALVGTGAAVCVFVGITKCGALAGGVGTAGGL